MFMRFAFLQSSKRYLCSPRSHCTISHTTPTAIMPKSCIICSAVASPDLQLQYCAACQSALYCSKACQKIDWREKQHRQMCKFLNVGHGDRQVRTAYHTAFSSNLKEQFEEGKLFLNDGVKRFYKLFEESTFEGSRAAAKNMKKIAKRQTKNNQSCMFDHSLYFLIHFSNSEMLSWPNSPLLVMLELVDPNMPVVEENFTPLHHLAHLADPFDYSTHVNQLILAKQFIERGANVNAISVASGRTPLQEACWAGSVTNLDFVELLLENGADPNVQDRLGLTPLMYSLKAAPGPAKFLLTWPTTDANITTRSGASILALVRSIISEYFEQITLPEDSERFQHQFLLQQWSEIEEMLMERESR
jgi:hypothetical protein